MRCIKTVRSKFYFNVISYLTKMERLFILAISIYILMLDEDNQTIRSELIWRNHRIPINTINLYEKMLMG